MKDEKEPSRHSNGTHAPLPYVVRLRFAEDEDKGAVPYEWRGAAYSLMEAVTQALFEASGSMDVKAESVRIEKVGPDIEGYADIIREMVARV